MPNYNPVKKCIACGERRNEIELIKIVKNKNQVLVDPSNNLPGRGVYICPNQICINKAKDNNLLSDALKTNINDKFYNDIMEEIINE
ncbi:MAG: YlxR family protein [Bacillota bacterium]